MRFLSLDIGTRRTGVAYLDTDVGIPLPLDTLIHTSSSELVTAVMEIVRERKIDRIIVGLPLLPSGDEGSQANISREVGSSLGKHGLTIEYADERYSSPRNSAHKNVIPSKNYDGDASAACAILSQKIDS